MAETARKLGELANAAPSPIQRKLLKLNNRLIKILDEPDRQQAAKKLYDDLQAVEKAIARQIEIEKVLYDIEVRNVPPGVRMQAEFNADSRNHRETSPELRKYLDSIEQKYFQK